MKILIVEDEVGSRKTLEVLLGRVGACDSQADGTTGVDAVRRALSTGAPYDLICLDIQMGTMDGHEALREIRKLEREHGLTYGEGARIVMTTSRSDTLNVSSAFRDMCDAYVVKPVTRARLFATLNELGIAA
jgi:two-component system, chemotaxis family, chemotaxis protein CheY